jgi:two-component system LytT family sensor kinase
VNAEPDERATAQRGNPLRSAAIVVAAAIGLGLASAARMLALYKQIEPHDAVLSGLMDWGTWLPFVPLIFLARRRVPLGGERPLAHILLHVVFAFALSFAQALTFAWITAVIRESALVNELRSALLVKLHAGVFVYWALLLGLHALEARREARAVELRRVEDARRLAEARFAALEGHLRPHFLFNTLNSIAAYVRDEPDKAEAMIGKLGGLLRRTIAARETVEVPLSSELGFVRDYLDIERARFGERLSVEFAVGESCRDALVPRLVLQPIVENAVQHGIAPCVDGGTISVRAEREGARVCLQVSDDGVGWEEGDAKANGFGLTAVRERIEALYGDRASISVRSRPTGGTAVEVSLPFQTEAER